MDNTVVVVGDCPIDIIIEHSDIEARAECDESTGDTHWYENLAPTAIFLLFFDDNLTRVVSLQSEPAF